MSPLATKSALWGAQNRLRGVRDNVEVLSPRSLDQAGIGTDGDELSVDVLALSARAVEDDLAFTTDKNLRNIYKDSAGIWHFVLLPFVIPPLILPTVPAGWNGTFCSGDSQAVPLDGGGVGQTLWLNVPGSFERVYINATPTYSNKNGDFSITSAELSWRDSSWTPPAPPAIPGSTIQTVPFDWWVELMIPNTSVAPTHADYNKPQGNSATSVNHGTREFYPPALYT